MNVRAFKYLSPIISMLAITLSLYAGSYWSFFALFYAFFLIPMLELFLPASEENLSRTEEEVMKKERIYDYMVWAIVPAQYLMMALFLYRVQQPQWATWEIFGFITAYGISCGVFGINVAHELGHRNTAWEQFLSKLLLLTSLYLHFFIEHNRGHHKHVSTDEDPASSKRNESLYAFWIRSVRDSWLSAWKLEQQRLEKTGQPVYSLHNEMLRFQFIQLGFMAAIAILFGPWVMLYYLGAATIGFLLLETVNYIEHYGLRRRKIEDAYYEKVMPIHSWNSNHPVGRLMLFELSRHSDHHYMANRKYQILRHFDESPQMPTGYPGMMVLSLFPPLWFKVMNAQIDRYKETQQGVDLA